MIAFPAASRGVATDFRLRDIRFLPADDKFSLSVYSVLQ